VMTGEDPCWAWRSPWTAPTAHVPSCGPPLFWTGPT